jgi:hypothetical protein
MIGCRLLEVETGRQTRQTRRGFSQLLAQKVEIPGIRGGKCHVVSESTGEM